MAHDRIAERFDIQIVHDKFCAAVHEDDDVHLESYLQSFRNSTSNKDLGAKMDTLNELLNHPEKSENFMTVKKMIEFEKDNGFLNKKGYTSGSRTLLGLHRGLGELKEEESTSFACREAYDHTLAKHHSFVIRNGAKIAIYTLPTKEILLQRVCGDSENIQKAMDMLPKNVRGNVDSIY
ncbi:hypothetical protein NQ317_013787 [Molorchus minor]|uniref:Glycolipid transfer protein domain-containing protein n=1 Tax=Molorchus minor TaxID=1323400 RepID=A0ABQ9IRV6_9CUCU|nr:hypothetical protein NQ317_013787 [Molorchus minor]